MALNHDVKFRLRSAIDQFAGEIESNDIESSASHFEISSNLPFQGDETSDKRMRPIGGLGFSGPLLSLVGLVVLWYTAAIVSITSSKTILLIAQFPFLLCSCQFSTAALTTYLISRLSRRHHGRLSGNIKPILSSFKYLIYQISISYTFGFVFTNISFSLVNASFAETVKAAEPISSVILGYIYLRELSSLSTYISLVVICLGVSVSCFHDDSFHMSGFFFALLSNFCFSSRAVLAKQLYVSFASSGQMDEISMFHHISVIGFIVLLPCMLFFEGKSILHFLFLSSYSSDTETMNLMVFCGLLFLNGLAYSIYNLASFYVISRSNIITHSVLNVFRRVFIILFTAFYFGVNLGAINLFGIALAVCGVVFFTYTKKG